MSHRAKFLFVTCQIGAEKAVKAEVAAHWADFHFAFSRPGFLTFKLPEDHRLKSDLELHSVFARAYGFSLGKVVGDQPEAMAREAWELYGPQPVERIHVWERDRAPAGHRGFEPSITPAAVAVYDLLRGACPRPERLPPPGREYQHAAAAGQWTLDCVVVEPGQWWIGFHRAGSVASRWPGGMMGLELPRHAASRAWLKMEEALRWSQLPVPPGARWAELGSAPGGASQALLERGFYVTGIDPAEMDPRVLGSTRFSHIRRRAVAVPRREFRKIRWLAADINAAPNYTLDVIESIVTHAEVHIRGMLLTLKLPQWELAAELGAYRDRIAGWGYNLIQARQLQHNRREICVAALQKPFQRKPLV